MRRRVLLAVLALAAVGVFACSLVAPGARPVPDAEHNVGCALEYDPAELGESRPDLLFLAWSSPYKGESFKLSLPDVLFHSAAAPGRRLRADLRIEGAQCATRRWREGARLPLLPSGKKAIVCARRDLAPVLFEVETKWGKCRATIAAGDTTPRLLTRLRSVKELPPLRSGQSLPLWHSYDVVLKRALTP